MGINTFCAMETAGKKVWGQDQCKQGLVFVKLIENNYF